MATALDIIKSAMRLIRVLDADETPSASDAQGCLFALNSMLKMWSALPDTIYQQTEYELILTPGDLSYSVGTGGDIPLDITRVNQAFLRVANTDLELRIYSESEYQEIPNKVNGGQPLILNYVRGSMVRLWPVPSIANTLRIICLVPFSDVALADVIVFPAEYQQALRYCLARDISSEYGQGLWTDELEAKYREANNAMLAMNLSQTMAPAKFNMPSVGISDIWWRARNFPT